MKKVIFLLLIHVAVTSNAQTITAEQAKDSVGKIVTVCGEVKGTYISKNGTHFLSFGAEYPDQFFTAVIYEDYVKLFPNSPAEYYRAKSVCVSGLITLYKKKPQIEVERVDQITLSDGTK